MWGGDCLDDDPARISYLYLTGHFVVKLQEEIKKQPSDLIGYTGDTLVSSFSVGGYSESYSVNTTVQNNLQQSALSTTSYGSTYFQMTVACRLMQSFAVVGGHTNP